MTWPPLIAAARHPNAETARVMVAAEVVGADLALAVRRPAELAAPDHQRRIEQAALLEVRHQRRRRSIRQRRTAA